MARRDDSGWPHDGQPAKVEEPGAVNRALHVARRRDKISQHAQPGAAPGWFLTSVPESEVCKSVMPVRGSLQSRALRQRNERLMMLSPCCRTCGIGQLRCLDGCVTNRSASVSGGVAHASAGRRGPHPGFVLSVDVEQTIEAVEGHDAVRIGFVAEGLGRFAAGVGIQP